MPWHQIIWDPSAGGNVEHVEAHDLTTTDVDFVLENPESTENSRSSGRSCAFGYAQDGRYIVVVYAEVDEDTVIPITAYEVAMPNKRRKSR